MPAAIVTSAHVIANSSSVGCTIGSSQEQQQTVKHCSLTSQPFWQPIGLDGKPSATMTDSLKNGYSVEINGSTIQLLQHAAPRITVLEAVLQQELSGLAANENHLNLIKQMLQQQQRTSANSTDAVAPVKSNSQSKQQEQQQQQQPIRVMPLLGLTLAQLVTQLQQHIQQQRQNSSSVDAPSTKAALKVLLQPGNNPLTSALGGTSSAFLLALHSELQRIRTLIGSCYDMMESELALIGQQLPPAVDHHSSGSDVDGATGAKKKSKKARNSNDTASALQPGTTTATAVGITADAAYASNIDIEKLQLRAEAVSYSLIQLDDFISASTTQLARLALQYDALLTAAATDSTPNGATAAVAAGSGTVKDGSFMGLLSRKQHAAHAQAQHGDKKDVEFLLMTPGVCSHSSAHQQTRYTAGIAPDIYHQAVHKLLISGRGSEPVLWGLSVVYARLQHAAEVAQAAAEESASSEAQEWTAPDKFTRSTTKYWVHPSNIMRLKLALLRHLPLLVYGAADPVHRGDISSRAALEAGSGGVTSLVSSVYFDSPALDVYHTRLAREEGARLVRIRYYGPRQTGPAGAEQSMFVERKTHHKRWTGERSVKERASLTQRQVSGYLSGETPAAEVNQDKEQLLLQVREFLTEWQQGPSLRTEYLRTAFQRYDSNSVRLSLDEHMLLVREGKHLCKPGDWCADVEGQAQLSSTDAVRFPYGILEIKLQEEAPAWVEELMQSGVIVPLQRFSKFCHGMALLYPDRCGSVPSWFTWDEAAQCHVPASLDEVRAMNAEMELPHEEPAVAASNKEGAAALRGLSLAPLKIPRLHTEEATPLYTAAALPASTCPAAASATAASAAYAGRTSNALPSAKSYVLQGVTAAPGGTADYAVRKDSACTVDDVLLGSGLHSPTAGSPTAAALARFSANSTAAGGSGPFNAGLNSSMGDVPGSQSDTSSASSSSSYRAAQAAAAPLGAYNSDDTMYRKSPTGAVASCCVAAGSYRALDNLAFSVDQRPLLHRQLTSSAEGKLSGDITADEGVKASASGGSFNKLMGFVRSGGKSRHSESGLGEVEFEQKPRRTSEGSNLQVSLPLDLLCGRSANTKSISSSSSQETLTAGRQTDSARSCNTPVVADAAAASPGAHAEHQKPMNTTVAPADKDASLLSAAGNSKLLLPNVQQLLTYSAAQQLQHQHQPQVVQVNYVAQQTSSEGTDALAAAAAFALGKDPALSGVVFTPSNTSAAKHLQELLPSVDASKAAVTAAAAAAAVVDVTDGGSTSSGGGRKGKFGRALSRLRTASRSLAGRAAGKRFMKGGQNNEHLIGFSGGRPASTSSNPRGNVRVEPKTFFANERTFLQWLNISVLVMMTGLGLLGGSSLMVGGMSTGGAPAACADSLACSAARISGAIIAPVSILFMLYALFLFKKRTRQIMLRSNMRYDDQIGPILLTILLVAVTLVSLILSVQAFKDLGIM